MGEINYIDMYDHIKELYELLDVSTACLWNVIKKHSYNIVAVRVYEKGFDIEYTEDVSEDVIKIGEALRTELSKLYPFLPSVEDIEEFLRKKKDRIPYRIDIIDISDGETENCYLIMFR